MSEATSERSSSLAKRAVALLVLIVAAYFLIRIVIGILSGIFTAILVVAALLAVVWAYRTIKRR